ncbi:uncharacterized protein LOC124143603 [Haliotis rufescens]|uniref:uncharacterized protein LOC124143603 n=1 Tax=Haliotis rufescens TaxID=6454 RepID=UPI00201F0EB5|nr:uncharacterized protein LOC124143603 [Haliotis rufescens]
MFMPSMPSARQGNNKNHTLTCFGMTRSGIEPSIFRCPCRCELNADSVRRVITPYRVFYLGVLVAITIGYMTCRSDTPFSVIAGVEQKAYGSCPSVLGHMLTGTWVTRPLTAREGEDIEAFLRHGLFFLNDDKSFEKPDKRCGNISYYQWMLRDKASEWFRVLCEPNGGTPCCYDNVCQKKTVEECVCDNCYDLRRQVHAEYSTWTPADARCQVRTFTSTSACELLRGGTYHFYGDSLIRQMFLAFIIILKGDYQHGGLRPDAPIDVRQKCSGYYVFPTHNCRAFLDYSPTLCNGTVRALFKQYTANYDRMNMMRDVKKIRDTPKSILFFGCGVWTFFNRDDTGKYARAVINMVNKFKKRTWPKLLWSGVHHFGLWRRPNVKGVDNEHAQPFNRYMETVLEMYNVPMFDTFNMTRGVRSVDGTHYGPGVNFLKAQIYLNYIMELQNKGQWN